MSNTIGERLYQLRKEHHLTMEEFGERIGVQKSAVNKYEKGRVDNLKRSTIEQICEAFNVTPQWLLGMEEEKSDIADQVAELMNRLNDEGKEKVLDYVSDLVASGRYAKQCSKADVV